jgi:GDPmannose 4,6-dehydratase
MTINYREAYGLFTTNGILFNHESPRRGETFVTRKITKGIAKIVTNKEKDIYLGNLESKRDWGYAGDFVEAMWLMMQHTKPKDYVIATGEQHSVKEFLEEAFKIVNLNWQEHVIKDSRYIRPTEVDSLLGDSTKAKNELGWVPKIHFKQLVKLMIESDIKEERQTL